MKSIEENETLYVRVNDFMIFAKKGSLLLKKTLRRMVIKNLYSVIISNWAMFLMNKIKNGSL